LHTGSIGIDDTKEAAIETALREWVLQYGTAIARALIGPGTADASKGSATPLLVGDLVVFPGATGIRGQSPVEFREHDSFNKRLVTHVSPLLESLIAGDGLHAMTLTLVFKEGAPIDGECRLDGQVSAPLLASVQQYAWPKVTDTFMLKQYYVFFGKTPK
jgi:hypothetical protein